MITYQCEMRTKMRKCEQTRRKEVKKESTACAAHKDEEKKRRREKTQYNILFWYNANVWHIKINLWTCSFVCNLIAFYNLMWNDNRVIAFSLFSNDVISWIWKYLLWKWMQLFLVVSMHFCSLFGKIYGRRLENGP